MSPRVEGGPPGLLRLASRIPLRVLLFALCVAVVAEGFLRVASLFAADRAGAWRPGAEVRILSVGDSHTFGTNVADDESYPAQLQQLLDEAAPGRFSVLNLGVPGMSSLQVRRRLAANVARYEPDWVIAWCGVNDYWNTSELDDPDAAWSTRLDSMALRSRFYRLLRVWQHDRTIAASTEALRADGVHQRTDLEEWRRRGPLPGARWTLHHGGRAESIRVEGTGQGVDADQEEERSYREFRAIAVWLRSAGIPLVLVRYPLGNALPFAPVNRAMERVAAELSLPIVDSQAAIARIPPEEQQWMAMSHPSGRMYREIARDLVPLVLRSADAAP